MSCPVKRVKWSELRNASPGLVASPGVQPLPLMTSSSRRRHPWSRLSVLPLKPQNRHFVPRDQGVYAKRPSSVNCSLFIATSMFVALSTATDTILSIVPNSFKMSLISPAPTGPACMACFCFEYFLSYLFPNDSVCCHCKVMVLGYACQHHWAQTFPPRTRQESADWSDCLWREVRTLDLGPWSPPCK